MKNRTKNRRHQTAYEAPEVEGEFLNESADTMLSVSDSLGNLTSTTANEIDNLLLEEFNEDQGSRFARPVETPDRATKRSGARGTETVENSIRAEREVRESDAETVENYIRAERADRESAENQSQSFARDEERKAKANLRPEVSARNESESQGEGNTDGRSRRALSADVLKAKVGTARSKVSEVATKVQDMIEPLKSNIPQRAQSLVQGARAQGGKVDQTLRSQPYLFALGALVAGIAVAKLFTPAESHRARSYS